MKISPMPSTANTVQTPQGSPDLLRSIKMNTNATPQHYDPGMPQETGVAQLGGTPDNGDKSDSVTDETKPISPQFARLAKERRALQVKERELKAREEALSSGAQSSEGIQVARLKAEPLKVLLENGVTYEDLSQAILQGQGNPDLIEVQNKLKALEEGVDKRFQDNASQQEQAVLAEMKREATKLAAAGEDFALIREMGRIDDVTSLIEKTYRQTGEVLDVTEAMGLVEEELLKDAERIGALDKIRAKVNPQPQYAPQPQRQQQPAMRTLTNRDTAAPVLDRKQRAIAAFYGRSQ